MIENSDKNKLFYSCLRSCHVSLFNITERASGSLDYNSSSHVSPPKKNGLPIYKESRLSTFLHTLCMILVSDNEMVVSCYLDIVERHVYISVDRAKINDLYKDKFKKSVLNIIDHIKDVNCITEHRQNSKERLGIKFTNDIIANSSKKINSRILNMKRKHEETINDNHPGIYDLIKEYEKSKSCIVFCYKLHNFMTDNNPTIGDEKLYRKINKLRGYVRFFRYINKLLEDKKYKDIMIDLCTNNKYTIYYSGNSDSIPTYDFKDSLLKCTGYNSDVVDEYIGKCNGDRYVRERLETMNNGKPYIIKVHSELCLIDNLMSNNIIHKKTKVNIYVSKLCCWCCFEYIRMLRGRGYYIYTEGTHGKIYDRWMIPDPQFIDEMMPILKEKLRGDIDTIVKVGVYSDTGSETSGQFGLNDIDERIDYEAINME